VTPNGLLYLLLFSLKFHWYSHPLFVVYFYEKQYVTVIFCTVLGTCLDNVCLISKCPVWAETSTFHFWECWPQRHWLMTPQNTEPHVFVLPQHRYLFMIYDKAIIIFLFPVNQANLINIANCGCVWHDSINWHLLPIRNSCSSKYVWSTPQLLTVTTRAIYCVILDKCNILANK